ATGAQAIPQITSDGAGGAVITWHDLRSGNWDIYAQRIDAGGNVQWTADGVAICTATGYQEYPQITYDGAGGAIITWQDLRSGNQDIYAQRIDAGGNVQWTADGVAVCMATGNQEYPEITSDGVGGAVITWYDRRSGNFDIYAQSIDAGGSVQWTTNGVSICTETSHQEYPEITSDGAGGAVITWWDYRSWNWDIYAQQVNRNGKVGYLGPEIHSVLDVPGDEGGWVNIAWDASRIDPIIGEIIRYTIWRALNTQAAVVMLDEGAVLFNGTGQVALETNMPVVRKQLLYGQTYYWELIDSHDAYYLEGYSKIVPTAFDSSAATSDYHYFQVIAHTSAPMTFYVSDPDSGYSVDNLAPAMPLGLAGEQIYVPEGITLTWDPNTEVDFSSYGVYRGLNEGFVPGPANLIASPCDTILFDGEWRWDGGYYYKVSAIDIHGNESPFALLRPEEVTGEDILDTPRAAFLSQNFPNPFNPQTKIAFGIRETTDVSLRIYDVSGHLVSVLVEESREAGRYEETWDGKDIGGRSVASGVYFYRLDAGAFTETKKMVLMR
ncbi:MAG: T9SS type A sorting domain-containing protein, partial [bacterium]